MKLCYHDSLDLAILESHACPVLESMVTAPCQVSKERQEMDREEGSRVEATTEKECVRHVRTPRRLSAISGEGTSAGWALCTEAHGEQSWLGGTSSPGLEKSTSSATLVSLSPKQLCHCLGSYKIVKPNFITFSPSSFALNLIRSNSIHF